MISGTADPEVLQSVGASLLHGISNVMSAASAEAKVGDEEKGSLSKDNEQKAESEEENDKGKVCSTVWYLNKLFSTLNAFYVLLRTLVMICCILQLSWSEVVNHCFIVTVGSWDTWSKIFNKNSSIFFRSSPDKRVSVWAIAHLFDKVLACCLQSGFAVDLTLTR